MDASKQNGRRPFLLGWLGDSNTNLGASPHNKRSTDMNSYKINESNNGLATTHTASKFYYASGSAVRVLPVRGRRFYLSVDGSGRKIARGSGRREEAVEVEGQAVELLVPAVPLERPEPHPPRQAPVFARVLGLQRVVQEHGHHQPHRRRRREDGVDVVVELSRT